MAQPIRRPTNIPTMVDPQSGSFRVGKRRRRPRPDYLASTTQTLKALGSDFPDADIEASGDLWARSKRAGLRPTETAILIYSATHHEHQDHRTIINEPPGQASQPNQASESVTVVHEPAVVIHEAPIPFLKVARDPAAHEQAMELARRVGPLDSTEKVYRFLAPLLEKEDQEIFLVLPLDLRADLRSAPYEIARGQRSTTVVGVSDVMRAVILSGCEGFIVAHNHPSGVATPSPSDQDLTKQIRKAAKGFKVTPEKLREATEPYGKDVKFLDHVVIGTGCIYSIVEDKRYPARGRFRG